MSILWRLYCKNHGVFGPWLRLSAESEKPTLRSYDVLETGDREWADFLRDHEYCPKALVHE